MVSTRGKHCSDAGEASSRREGTHRTPHNEQFRLGNTSLLHREESAPRKSERPVVPFTGKEGYPLNAEKKKNRFSTPTETSSKFPHRRHHLPAGRHNLSAEATSSSCKDDITSLSPTSPACFHCTMKRIPSHRLHTEEREHPFRTGKSSSRTGKTARPLDTSPRRDVDIAPLQGRTNAMGKVSEVSEEELMMLKGCNGAKGPVESLNVVSVSSVTNSENRNRRYIRRNRMKGCRCRRGRKDGDGVGPYTCARVLAV